MNNKKKDNSRLTDSKNGRLTIGLAADDILLVGGRNALLGVADVTQEHDLNLICFHQLICQRDKQTPAEMGPAAWDTLMEVMDGLVIYQSWPNQEAFTKFRNRFPNLPMVNALRVHAGCPALTPDFYRGTKELTRHLIEVHGYRRIAFATGPEGWSVEGRYRGYAEALAEHDLPLNPNLVTPYLGWVEAERRAVSILMDERKLRPGTDFEAVVGTNDSIALSVLDELQRRGVRVPNDVAVVGFDDDNRSSCSTPPLTTARLPTYEVGRQAAEILLAQLAGEQVPEQTLVPAQIMIRRSCGCLNPLVAQAAARSRPTVGLLPPSPPAATFNEILTTQRTLLLSEMVQAVEDQTGGAVLEWVEQLLSDFAAEIRGEAPGRFVSTLEDVLYQVMAAKGGRADSGQRVAAWQGVMSALRKNALPYLNDETYSRAEDLWQQARVAIGKAAYQAYERRTLQVEQQLQILREIERALITTTNVSELMDVLATGLPRLGISSYYLSLYENPALYQEPKTPPRWSRLMLACAKRGRVELEAEGQRFLSRQLVPTGMLGPDRYSFVVEPLYVLRDQLGFVLFELGPRETNVYRLLRQGISSTLKGALLVQQVQENAAEISRQKYVLDSFMDNVPDTIYFKDRDSRLTQVNRAFTDRFDIAQPTDAVGKTDFDLFLEEEARPKYDQEQEIIRTGHPILGLEEPDVEEKWALTTKMPLRDENDNIIGTFGISRDITELKHAQHDVEIANKEINTLNEQLKEENLRMSAELDVARRLQEMILPPPEELKLIEGLDIVGFMQPADEVGGDYYDVLHKNGTTHIGIGDVTGHGLESGVLMLMTQTAIRTLIDHGETDPVKFVNTLNRTIYNNVRRTKMDKSLTFALVNFKNGQLKIVGQHEEMLVVRANGQVERVNTLDLGLPLGLKEEIAEWVNQAIVELAPGEGIVLYTDGFTEAANDEDELYGLERLCEVVSQNWHISSAEEVKQAVVEDVTRHIGQQIVYDDLTMVVLKQQ